MTYYISLVAGLHMPAATVHSDRFASNIFPLLTDLSDSTLSYTETEATNSPNVTPRDFSGKACSQF